MLLPRSCLVCGEGGRRNKPSHRAPGFASEGEERVKVLVKSCAGEMGRISQHNENDQISPYSPFILITQTPGKPLHSSPSSTPSAHHQIPTRATSRPPPILAITEAKADLPSPSPESPETSRNHLLELELEIEESEEEEEEEEDELESKEEDLVECRKSEEEEEEEEKWKEEE
ncbi:hypothetical protein O3P69_009004 [Scylla paramamosain]|uniref:Uncharacterized protein n=1 Tax=Scylla paramamosain TaxID=85552 RepID=A0AAW0TRA2_SCYPA